MNRIESIPQIWDDDRDGKFFAITAALFPPNLCYGASVLLASYDADEVSATPARITDLAAKLPVQSPAHTSSRRSSQPTSEGPHPTRLF